MLRIECTHLSLEPRTFYIPARLVDIDNLDLYQPMRNWLALHNLADWDPDDTPDMVTQTVEGESWAECYIEQADDKAKVVCKCNES